MSRCEHWSDSERCTAIAGHAIVSPTERTVIRVCEAHGSEVVAEYTEKLEAGWRLEAVATT